MKYLRLKNPYSSSLRVWYREVEYYEDEFIKLEFFSHYDSKWRLSCYWNEEEIHRRFPNLYETLNFNSEEDRLKYLLAEKLRK